MDSIVTSLANLWGKNPIAQSFGLAATALVFLSALQKSDKSLQGVMLLGTITWVLHYSLLGSWVAAISYIVGVARNFSIYFDYVHRWGRYRITLLFLVAYSLVGFFTITHPIEIIPCICSSLYAVALFNFTGIRMRLVMMIAQLLWFAFAFSVGSIGGCITCLGEFCLTILTVSKLLSLRTKAEISLT